MGAEDAAVDMRLVDHDIAEVLEDVTPTVVLREDSHVEHVGVGQDHVRPLADLPTSLRLGIAVVDRGAEARQAKRSERARLILGERLGGIQVEGAKLRLGCERGENGEVEGKRLPAGRPGGDDDVLAAGGCVHGLGLVAVETSKPELLQSRSHPWVQAFWDRHDVRSASRDLGGVCNLLPGEEFVPGRGNRCHETRC